jgi:hypothetical protein
LEKPDWKLMAQTLLPLVTAAGAISAVAFLPHGAHDAGDMHEFIANLSANLTAGGLGALCRPRRLWAEKEYRETLANHDIRHMIKTAWGEAALASLREYCAARPAWPPSLVNSGTSDSFHKAVASLKAGDFLDGEPDVATIHVALAASRRALLSEVGPALPVVDAAQLEPSEEAIRQHTAKLNSALIDSVLSTIAKRPGADPAPEDLRDFLEGRNGAETSRSLLDQLCIYVAYYLKTNPRAQTAILHFTFKRSQIAK